MIFENYLKCIPMLKSIDEQRYKEVVFTQASYWICPKNYLLPFQVNRKRSPSTNFTFVLVDSMGAETDLMPLLEVEQLNAFTGTNGTDIIQFVATQVFELDCELFYYKFSDGVETWYSEVFRVVNEEINIDKELDVVDGMVLEVGEPNTPTPPPSTSGGFYLEGM